MKTPIVLTIIADDQPGIIKTVSEVLYQHDGSWSESSMSSLAGKFAGILLASVPSEKAIACVQQLEALEASGIRVIAHVSEEPPATKETREYLLNLVGNNRRGIVHECATGCTLECGHRCVGTRTRRNGQRADGGYSPGNLTCLPCVILLNAQ
jgi:glycine cleavage system regulatory protein